MLKGFVSKFIVWTTVGLFGSASAFIICNARLLGKLNYGYFTQVHTHSDPDPQADKVTELDKADLDLDSFENYVEHKVNSSRLYENYLVVEKEDDVPFEQTIPKSSLLGRVIYALFFYGLSEPRLSKGFMMRKDNLDSCFNKERRNKLSSPFFTKSEQLAMRYIKATDAEKKGKLGSLPSNLKIQQPSISQKSLSQKLSRYIDHIQEKIKVLNITIAAYQNENKEEEEDEEGSQDERTRAEYSKLCSELTVLNSRLEKAKVELVSVTALTAE